MDNIIERIKQDKILRILKPILDGEKYYVVGGFIRDILNGSETLDRDIITEAEKAEKTARKIADKTGGYFVELDAKNRIYRVIMPDKKNYIDTAAMLNNDLMSDIKRRDLTINSIVYDPSCERLIDPERGAEDLKNGILRTASLSNFTDDPLRMLRVFRFQAKYGGKPTEEIIKFIEANKFLIKKCAAERITAELMKLTEGKYAAESILSADKCGLWSCIFPTVEEIKKIPPNTHHHLDLFNHTVETMRQTEFEISNFGEETKKIITEGTISGISRKALLKFAALFHDIGKPSVWTTEKDTGKHRFIMHDEVGADIIEPIMKELKFSGKQTAYVKQMIKHHIYPSALVRETTCSSRARMRFYRKLGEYVPDVIVLAASDRLSARGPAVSEETVNTNLSNLRELLTGYYENLENIKMPEPYINGNEMSEITGLKQSPELGRIIKAVYAAQADGQINTKEEARELALNILKSKNQTKL